MNTAVKTKETTPVGHKRSRHKHVIVSARVARYWLDRNASNNRGPKTRKIGQYAKDMLADAWVDTGDCIKITSDEKMIDGGQRMRAVELAAKTNPHIAVEMTFAFDVPYEAIFHTDTGAARTFADGLQIKERVNRNSLGAIVRRMYLWDVGNFIDQRGTSSAATDPTMRDLHELEESNPEQFAAATARGMDIRAAKIGNPTAAGTAYYIFNRIDHEEANAFFDQLVKGANLPEGSPILTLRDRLKASYLPHNRAHSLTTTEQLYLYMRAWNGFRRDEVMNLLVLPARRNFTNARFIQPI